VKGLIWVAAGSAGEDGAPEARTGTAALRTEENARGWFAAYLGDFPQGATVPRWKLRNIASRRWPDAEDRQGRPLRTRQERRGGPSKGRRSSQKLADELKGFEELGLIRRDNARDAVIITDPVGLRGLAALPAGRPGGQDGGPGGNARRHRQYAETSQHAYRRVVSFGG
jgi:hypothetical protein